MKSFNVAAAAVLGAAAALSAGVLTYAAPAAAVPPGLDFCWAHLMPTSEQCPAIAPWGTRWKACESETLYFVLDDPSRCKGNYPRNAYSDEAYTMNCWGRFIYLGKICPAQEPSPGAWRACPVVPGHVAVWTLDGDCNRPA